MNMSDSGIKKKKKKLTKDTSTTSSKNGLSCTDICNIIRACAKGGVSTLNYKDLSISIEDKAPEVTVDPSWNSNVWPSHGDITVNGATPGSYNTLDNGPVMVHTNDTSDNLPTVSEEDIEELKITNPAAYEEIMENTHA